MRPDHYRRQFGDGKATAEAQAPAKGAFVDDRLRIGGTRAYDAGIRGHRQMKSWDPRIGGADREALGSRDTIVARARDLVRNNPVISGGLDRRAEAVVGSRLRLQAMPDFEAMGRDWQWASAWALNVESQFRVWDRDTRRLCDAERAQTFGQMMETAYRHWWVDGEALAYVEMRDRGSAYQTCIRLIDPDRLQNPDSVQDETVLPNGNQVVGGVEIDTDGVVVAYHIRVQHPDSLTYRKSVKETDRIEREDRDGRPRVIHAFKRNRAQQRRGVSRLVASMRKIRMLDKYDDAELEGALLRATRAPYVRTTASTDEVRQGMGQAPTGNEGGEQFVDKWFDYREEEPLYIEGVGFTALFPNEEIGWATVEGPPSHYADFRAEGLRSVASDFGLSHQQLAQNWEDVNYSSARTLLNEIWRGLLDDRWNFTQSMPALVYAAWLQEAVAIGKVKAPGGPLGFFRYRAELTMSEWLGPGRGSIDRKKESDASDLDLAAGRTNLSIEAGEQGRDARDILMGRARDKALIEGFGLEDMIGPQAAVPPTASSPLAPTETEPEE
ncbi:phage portal protein [Novosphingobium gossypii]|uniref:phage portal protein n=1 Tax=Novosphingobium gossypii TaxID=1604774 RepID=UPI003D24C1EC